MSLQRTVQREVRVALSKKAQPVRFRLLKWAVILTALALLWRSPYFWRIVLTTFTLSLTLHFIWRWKTKGWTQPWGGWNDIDTAGKE